MATNLPDVSPHPVVIGQPSGCSVPAEGPGLGEGRRMRGVPPMPYEDCGKLPHECRTCRSLDLCIADALNGECEFVEDPEIDRVLTARENRWLRNQERRKKERSRNMRSDIICGFLFFIVLTFFIVIMAYCAPATPAEGPPYSKVEVPPTDGGIETLEQACLHKSVEMLPRFVGGMFNSGNTVHLIRLSSTLAAPLQANAVAPGERVNRWAVRLFQSRLEDQIRMTDSGQPEARRPYFAALTEGGSIIRGFGMYDLTPEDLRVVLRVTANGNGGFDLTYIHLVK
jgi:hypothetical protein